MNNETTINEYGEKRRPKRLPRDGINIPRDIVFPINAFDYLKTCQRVYLERNGRHLNNSEILAVIMAQHRDTIGSTGVAA